MRVLIHAGFHKTGTKSVQDMLRQHRSLLAPAVRMALKEDLPDLATVARQFSRNPSDANSVELSRAIAGFVATIAPNDPRPLLISSEDLAGYIPGRYGVLGYPHAADILIRLRDALLVHLGQGTDIQFYLSTRAPLPWVHSCYAQHVRHARMTQDRDDYAAGQRGHSDLAAMAEDVRRALAPTPVHDLSLEQISRLPLGPVAPLLDLIDLDPVLRAQMTPLPASNTSVPPDVLDDMLRLNRSNKPKEALNKAKRLLVALANEGQT